MYKSRGHPRLMLAERQEGELGQVGTEAKGGPLASEPSGQSVVPAPAMAGHREQWLAGAIGQDWVSGWLGGSAVDSLSKLVSRGVARGGKVYSRCCSLSGFRCADLHKDSAGAHLFEDRFRH